MFDNKTIKEMREEMKIYCFKLLILYTKCYNIIRRQNMVNWEIGTVIPKAVIEKNHTKGRANKPIKEIKQKHKTYCYFFKREKEGKILFQYSRRGMIVSGTVGRCTGCCEM